MTLISGSNQERRTMEIRDERQPRITQIAQIKTFPIGTFREIGGQNIDKRSFFPWIAQIKAIDLCHLCYRWLKNNSHVK